MSKATNVKEAKKSLKHHIQFFESLKSHITIGHEPMRTRAMFAAYCLHRYINHSLMDDIAKAIEENRDKSNDN